MNIKLKSLLKSFFTSTVIVILLGSLLYPQEKEIEKKSEKNNEKVQDEAKVPYVIIVRGKRIRQKDYEDTFEVLEEKEELLDDMDDLDETIQDMPSVELETDKHGFGRRRMRVPGSRGMSFIDGIRLFNPITRLSSRRSMGTFDSLMLDKVKMISGPQSVVYGSDTSVGAVDLIPQTPVMFSGGIKSKYRTRGNFNSNNNGFGIHADTSLTGFNKGVVAGGTYGYNGDRKLSSKAPYDQKSVENSNFSYAACNTAIGTTLGKKLSLIGSFQYYRIFSAGENYRPEVYIPKVDRFMGYLKLFANDINFMKEFFVTTSFHRQSLNRETSLEDMLLYDENAVNSYAVLLKGKSAVEQFEFTYGTDFYKEKLFSNSSTSSYINNSTTALSRGEYQGGSTFDYYSGYFYSDFKATKDISLLAGLRYNIYDLFSPLSKSYEAGTVDDIDRQLQSFTGSGGIVWNWLEDLKNTFTISRGYRVPTLTELTSERNVETEFKEVVNPELDPQSFYKSDFSLTYEKKKKYSIGLDFVYLRSKDLIDYRYLGDDNGTPVLSKINVDSNVYGFQIRGKLTLWDALTVSARISANYAKNAKDGSNLSNIHPPRGSIGLGGMIPVFGKPLMLKASYRQHFSQGNLSKVERILYDGETPAWYMINFRAHYMFNPKSSIFFRIANLTDQLMIHQRIRTEETISYGPGFHFAAGFDLTF